MENFRSRFQSDFTFEEVIRILWSYRMAFILGTVFILLFAFLITSKWVITPLYRSSTVIYPSNTEQLSTEDPSEQLIQILYSDYIYSNLKKEFNLIDHYQLDKDDPKVLKKLNDILEDRVSFNKTQYSSIGIEIYDKDPDIAARMVQRMVELTSLKLREMMRDKYLQLAESYKREYLGKRKEVQLIQDSIRKIQVEMEIFNPEEEAGSLADRYIELQSKLSFEEAKVRSLQSEKSNPTLDTLIILSKSNIEGYRASLENVSPTIKNLYKTGESIISLNRILEMERIRMSELKSKYEQAMFEAEKEVTYTLVVTPAVPAILPAKPNKKIIIPLIVLSFWVVFLVIIAFLESYRK